MTAPEPYPMRELHRRSEQRATAFLLLALAEDDDALMLAFNECAEDPHELSLLALLTHVAKIANEAGNLLSEKGWPLYLQRQTSLAAEYEGQF